MHIFHLHIIRYVQVNMGKIPDRLDAGLHQLLRRRDRAVLQYGKDGDIKYHSP